MFNFKLHALVMGLAFLSFMVEPCAAQAPSRLVPIDSTLTLSALDQLLNAPNATVVRGDLSIDLRETHAGPLVVLDGNIYVSGTIDGSLTVVNGSASLQQEAIVEGDVVAVNGYIYASSDASISGILRRNELNIRVKQADAAWQVTRVVPTRMRFGAGPSGWRFSRVRGHEFALGLGWRASRQTRYPDISSTTWIPTTDNNHGYLDFSTRIDQPISLDRSLSVVIEGYKITDTNDDWNVPRSNNSLDAFFVGDDFYNYYLKRGFTISLRRAWQRRLVLGLSFGQDTYYNLAGNNPFSLFGGTPFRNNPDIDEGKIHGVTASLRLDTRQTSGQSGWYADMQVESALGALGSDFEYTRYDLTIRRYNSWRGHGLDFRLKLAGSDDPLPLQKSYVLGSYSGLRGFGHFEYAGDRILVFNADYRIPLKTFRQEAMLKWNLDLQTFFDTGTAFFSKSSGRNGIAHPAIATRINPIVSKPLPDSYSDLRSDVGVGLSLSSRVFYLSLQLAQNVHNFDAGPRALIFIYKEIF
jgi:hypothetical protein